MANLFKRLKNSLEADFHEMLDSKEQKNPIALLNQYLRECEQEVERVRKLVERQYLLKEEFTREHNQAYELAAKRKRQAEIASNAGEIELHQFAIQEQNQYEERTDRLKESRDQAIQQLDELEQKYEEMKHKLKDMHIKRMELMGRENMTRAHHKMNTVLDSTKYSNKPFSRFEEMENYLDRLEHQVNTGYHRHTIDARITQIEKASSKKEEESSATTV
ncbi:PspA/IM30 family protein [Pseudalkalibacillus decolorationis]|uniref:PspA/IM30 family protein n=1 Tax=Pseudalkalibacillus decolorationis TaxID=163879 RepID=UPI0021472B21|nr:PspA/IM30 family protein [Pseudalkalibacillus decolorationis]